LRVGLGAGLLLLVLVGGELHLPLLVGERLLVSMMMLLMYVLVLVGVRLLSLLPLLVGIGLLLAELLVVVLRLLVGG
jgi:hypothetical protein